ncbi:MAG: FAD-binding protein [Clostridia bacterium]|nr:FAD-binding protein [Clostridia bacterium]
MECQNVYDIAVVGAGPAGAVFVKELAQARPDLAILLIDGQSPDSAKPCGGLLAPDAQKLLAIFDLVLPKSILEDPQIFAVETIDIDQKLVRYYQRHYLNMDRYAFDQWLLSLVSSHVTVINGRCNRIRKDDLYRLSVQSGEEEREISAKVLVGADGGGSVVRRTFFKPMSVQYVAIQQWFENRGQRLPYYSCIFDAKTSDSCSWTIHKGNYVIFGGAFEKQGCRQAFDAQKERLEAFLGNSFGDAVKTEACLVSSPRALRDFCTGGDGVFLLGEAAGFISASSFEGLSSAMLSGKILADAIAEGKSLSDAQQLYRKHTRSLRHKLRLKSVKRTLLCSPFTRSLIMKSGIQSIRPYTKK